MLKMQKHNNKQQQITKTTKTKDKQYKKHTNTYKQTNKYISITNSKINNKTTIL